jgi:hypothetical protein
MHAAVRGAFALACVPYGECTHLLTKRTVGLWSRMAVPPGKSRWCNTTRRLGDLPSFMGNLRREKRRRVLLRPLLPAELVSSSPLRRASEMRLRHNRWWPTCLTRTQRIRSATRTHSAFAYSTKASRAHATVDVSLHAMQWGGALMEGTRCSGEVR